jgi:hypothetical protein
VREQGGSKRAVRCTFQFVGSSHADGEAQFWATANFPNNFLAGFGPPRQALLSADVEVFYVIDKY